MILRESQESAQKDASSSGRLQWELSIAQKLTRSWSQQQEEKAAPVCAYVRTFLGWITSRGKQSGTRSHETMANEFVFSTKKFPSSSSYRLGYGANNWSHTACDI
jgi:hypothetical protein